jgi:uncharacterized protein (DUF342 family)
MSARVILQPGLRRETVNDAFRAVLLDQAGVAATDAVLEAFDRVLAEPAGPGQAVRAVIAQGTPPQPGADGQVEWLIDQTPAEDDGPSHDGRVNFYDQSPYISVTEGQTLGIIHPPTAGTPGHDVTGRVLSARDGKPCHLKLDESITIRPDGQIIANRAGVLSRFRGKAGIQQLLHVEKHVDFHTGNLDFDGDIVVNRDVRDRFSIKATGNVTICGLIEAATIECGGDLQARGGFAGRELGHARVTGDMHARYLNEAGATVIGDLHVAREALNCQIDVHGSARMPHAVIIGGELRVGGRLECRNLGSEAGVRTVVRIGLVPALEPMARRLEQIIASLEQEHCEKTAGRQRLESISALRHLTAGEWEQIAHAEQRIEALNERLDQARSGLGTLHSRIEAKRVFDVTIHGKLCAGVELHTPTAVYAIQRDLPGPLHITRDAHENLIYLDSVGRQGLLGQIAQARLAA